MAWTLHDMDCFNLNFQHFLVQFPPPIGGRQQRENDLSAQAFQNLGGGNQATGLQSRHGSPSCSVARPVYSIALENY